MRLIDKMIITKDDKKYGVKVTIIASMDFNDYIEILDSIKKLGYEIELVDNGNAVCTKGFPHGKLDISTQIKEVD